MQQEDADLVKGMPPTMAPSKQPRVGGEKMREVSGWRSTDDRVLRKPLNSVVSVGGGGGGVPPRMYRCGGQGREGGEAGGKRDQYLSAYGGKEEGGRIPSAS